MELPSTILSTLLWAHSPAIVSNPLDRIDWPMYVGSMPDDGDKCAAIYDTQGIVNARHLSTGIVEDAYGIQIKVRSLSNKEAGQKLFSIVEVLDTLRMSKVVVGSVTYKINTIIRTSPPALTGQDEKRRSLWTVNVILMLV